MRLIADNIYAESEGLIGSRCAACGELFFPQVTSCSQCSSQTMERHALGSKGRLWSWTMQHFMPKPPFNSGESKECFTPYGVGLVELDCGLIIKTRLGSPQQPFAIGDAMTLRIVPFRKDADGVVGTYEFRQDGSH